MGPEPPLAAQEGISDEAWEEAKSRLNFYFGHHGGASREDQCQETLTRVLSWIRAGNQIEGKDGFQKLCYGFARKVLLESLERSRRKQTDQLDSDLPDKEGKTLGLSRREVAVWLNEILALLSPPDREIILAAEVMDAALLAKTFGTTVPNATLRLCRARKRLRRLMESPTDSRGPK
jgi:DNA-directed RNA polymerase specialized sigma24 family protein